MFETSEQKIGDEIKEIYRYKFNDDGIAKYRVEAKQNLHRYMRVK